jgi:hypothetical protein
MPPRYTVERLAYEDEDLGSIDLPKARMDIRSGFGSGLSRRPGDPPDVVWAVGDRGPNLKAKTARKIYGVEGLEEHERGSGAKLMPRLDLGPAIARLRVREDRVELMETFRIACRDGTAVSGLPIPGGEHARSEPALGFDGKILPPDPSGMDTEGIVALPDGFWLGDEYGPSLIRLDGEGRVLRRLMPERKDLEGAAYPVETCLPAIAARRQLNRGFEALTLSPDGRHLFLAFQSPLAHPDEATHEQARHVRLWRLDAETGAIEMEWLYPLDAPETFRRDVAKGEFGRSDVKVSEICALGEGSLLVLERGSETTRIYRVEPSEDLALPAEHLDVATRPTLEERSARGEDLPALAKHLLVDTDENPEVAADLEGIAILSPTELLLVSDNDFGVEGAKTSFWRVRFEEPVLG